ncbi:MAG: CC0125/CC1285 family lipoprotein [Candidatus Rokuibacteriota bacterium]
MTTHRATRPGGALLGALALLVAACAPTPYRPQTLEGGYADTRVNADTFNVVFQGNAQTSRQIAETYALYRCAELTVESGFDYFVVIGGNSGALYGGKAGSAPSNSSGKNPSVVVLFKAFKGEKPSGAVFNARDVLRELGPSIVR